MNAFLRKAALAAMLLPMIGTAGPLALADQKADDINAIIRALDIDERAPTITIKAPQSITITIDGKPHTIVVDAGRSVDVTVFFKYDSAELTKEGKAALDRLGAALASRQLQAQRFLIAGHTDAKGSREYNRRLSLRRAEAVKKYLVENWKIDPARLEVYGWGEDRLKDPAHPFAAINRRVEVSVILPPEVVRYLSKTKVLVNGRIVSEMPGKNVTVNVTVKQPASPETRTTVTIKPGSKECPQGALEDPRPPTQPLDDFGGRRTPVPCPSTESGPARIKLNN